MEMGFIAVTRTHHSKRLLRHRTELLAMTEAFRALARERKMGAGAKGLVTIIKRTN